MAKRNAYIRTYDYVIATIVLDVYIHGRTRLHIIIPTVRPLRFSISLSTGERARRRRIELYVRAGPTIRTIYRMFASREMYTYIRTTYVSSTSTVSPEILYYKFYIRKCARLAVPYSTRKNTTIGSQNFQMRCENKHIFVGLANRYLGVNARIYYTILPEGERSQRINY